MEIPEIFKGDVTLSHNTCSITKKWIRFIFIPRGGEDNKYERIYYDESVIKEWIIKTPNLAPPGWPIHRLPTPLSLKDIEPSKGVQKLIDQRMGDMLKQRVKNKVEAYKKQLSHENQT